MRVLSKTAAFILVFAFFFITQPAFAESIGGISLGDSLAKVKTLLGEPNEHKGMGKNKTAYYWEKSDNSVKIIAAGDVVEYVQASSGISSKGKNKTFATKKGVYPGAIGKSIEKLYGKARNDYGYPSEDCFVMNYKTGRDEQLIFRIYGFSDRGAIVIDVILCKNDFPKDKIWKE